MTGFLAGIGCGLVSIAVFGTLLDWRAWVLMVGLGLIVGSIVQALYDGPQK